MDVWVDRSGSNFFGLVLLTGGLIGFVSCILISMHTTIVEFDFEIFVERSIVLLKETRLHKFSFFN